MYQSTERLMTKKVVTREADAIKLPLLVFFFFFLFLCFFCLGLRVWGSRFGILWNERAPRL